MSNKNQPVSVSQFTQLRLAIVLNGGVSLAVWIGGVCDELLRLVVAGRALRASASNGPFRSRPRTPIRINDCVSLPG